MNKGIGIAGIAGRMGRLLAEETLAAGLPLVGGIDRPGAESPARLFPDIASLAAAIPAAGAAWVLGTTGLDAAQEAAVAEAGRRGAVVYAPNYSPGVTLLLALAEQMAAALPAEGYDAEIVEMHHRQKVDAPSGTAVGLGRAVARGRGVRLEDVTESGRDGHTGPRKTGAIGFAALRGGQVVGEHTVLFAAANEHIALSHRAFDRRAFASGAIRAAQWVHGRPAGLYGMTDVLGMRRG